MGRSDRTILQVVAVNVSHVVVFFAAKVVIVMSSDVCMSYILECFLNKVNQLLINNNNNQSKNCRV